MEIAPLAGQTPLSDSAAATQSLTENFDTFLLMLTTQLQHQDPLAPTDTTEFTNQLVQFSQLEQQIKQTGKVEDLIALQQAQENIAALGYLGNAVEVQSDLTLLEDGSADFAYEMPAGAETASIAILNSAGRIVRILSADPSAGRHEVRWDGEDEQGVLQPNGPYTVVVSAVDANDVPLEAIPVFFTGIAEAVTQEDGTTFVKVGPVKVPLDRINSVQSTAVQPTS